MILTIAATTPGGDEQDAEDTGSAKEQDADE